MTGPPADGTTVGLADFTTLIPELRTRVTTVEALFAEFVSELEVATLAVFVTVTPPAAALTVTVTVAVWLAAKSPSEHVSVPEPKLQPVAPGGVDAGVA